MATQHDPDTRRKRSRNRQERSSSDQTGRGSGYWVDALSRGISRIIETTADLTEEATEVIGGAVRSMRSKPILDESDFSEFRSWKQSSGTLRMSVLSVKPLAGGKVINGYRCNNNIEITIRIADSERPRLYADYLRSQRRLKESIGEAIDSDDFRLVSVTPREGSLILVLVICIAGLAIWMASQNPEFVEWFQENKEEVDYWTRVTSNSLNILTKIFFIFGGGSPA